MDLDQWFQVVLKLLEDLHVKGKDNCHNNAKLEVGSLHEWFRCTSFQTPPLVRKRTKSHHGLINVVDVRQGKIPNVVFLAQSPKLLLQVPLNAKGLFSSEVGTGLLHNQFLEYAGIQGHSLLKHGVCKSAQLSYSWDALAS
eukprot:4173440-Amphidinium_carterae.3